jgi:hypothetical protein
MANSYAIADEPQPGSLAQYAVNPFWPLVAFMFAGVWASWTWFLFNGYVVGSPTFRKECRMVLMGLCGTLVFFFGGSAVIGSLVDSAADVKKYSPYLLSILLLWKLWISYLLMHEQGRTFEIFEHYGGKVRNGVFAVIAAAFFSPVVLRKLVQVHPVFGPLFG